MDEQCGVSSFPRPARWSIVGERTFGVQRTMIRRYVWSISFDFSSFALLRGAINGILESCHVQPNV